MAFSIDRAWFCYEDHAGQPRAEIITADMNADAASTSPVAHVLDKITYRQWQSPDNNEWFQIDFGANVSIQCLAVVFPRITNPYRRYDTQEIIATDTIRHYLDASAVTPGAGAIFDSGSIQCGVDPKRGYHVIALASAVTARYWRCNITATSRAAEGFFLVSLAMAGPIFQPSFNHVYGERLGYPDNAEVQRTPTSQASFVTRNERTLIANLVWDFIPDTERAAWAEMDEYAGTSEPVVFAIASPDATAFTASTGPNGWVIESDKVMVGLFEGDGALSSRTFNASIKQVNLVEHR